MSLAFSLKLLLLQIETPLSGMWSGISYVNPIFTDPCLKKQINILNQLCFKWKRWSCSFCSSSFSSCLHERHLSVNPTWATVTYVTQVVKKQRKTEYNTYVHVVLTLTSSLLIIEAIVDHNITNFLFAL